MTQSVAQDTIALLIDLTERGEIDPWDVQVIDVIDRFLSELAPIQSSVGAGNTYEADLSRSGQAFLYASMLVLLKADSLARLEALEDGEESDCSAAVDWLTPDALESALPSQLERQLYRRATARPPQQRRVTLQELISQLEVMAAAIEEQPTRLRSRRPRLQSRAQVVRTIARLAHQENLVEVAAQLEALLSEPCLDIQQADPWIDFECLVEHWSQVRLSKPDDSATVPNQDRDPVGIFWALLLLSAQSKVELAQEEFYQDLKVRRVLPEEAMGLSWLEQPPLPPQAG